MIRHSIFKFFNNLTLGKLIILFFLIFSIAYIIFRSFISPSSVNNLSYSNNNFSVLGMNIPTHLDFCGEKIPSNNFAISKSLEKEFFTDKYWKTNSRALFLKAQKWFPYIEPILKKNGVPDDFKYVAFIESHLSNIKSPAGAAGFWQLIPSTARKYGLEVNEYIDERYHVEKSTEAACKLIKEAHKVFNNWTLAAAAYNRGIGGIQKALKVQNAESYYQLLLNNETGSFVYRILAYKTLFSSPKHFDIKLKKWKYLSLMELKQIKIDSSVQSISSLSKHIRVNNTVIKLFNPWILSDALPNPDQKLYIIRVPKNEKRDYSSYLRDLYGEDGRLNYDAKTQEEDSIPESLNITDSLQIEH
ncbi:MAG: lytic transglycosylase domain-containing protein [Sphingobacteriaceae bacterium]|nr:lytic transglycosylase domain-containing protein [Sphingobacteriaceae bacterium]